MCINKMITGLLALFFTASLAVAAQDNKSQEIKGKVEVIVGKAYVKDLKKWKPLSISDEVSKEDMIKVAQGGSVRIRLSNGSMLEVAGGKTVVLATLMGKSAARKGSMGNLIKKLGKSTPGGSGVTAVAGVRGADVSKQKKKVKTEDLSWKK